LLASVGKHGSLMMFLAVQAVLSRVRSELPFKIGVTVLVTLGTYEVIAQVARRRRYVGDDR
jgi:hypothetical protein